MLYFRVAVDWLQVHKLWGALERTWRGERSRIYKFTDTALSGFLIKYWFKENSTCGELNDARVIDEAGHCRSGG